MNMCVNPKAFLFPETPSENNSVKPTSPGNATNSLSPPPALSSLLAPAADNLSHITADADIATQTGSAIGQILANSLQQNSGVRGYMDSLHTGGELLAHHSLEGLKTLMQPSGPAGFGVVTGATVFGIPSAAVLLKSALHDIADMNKLSLTLKNEREHYKQKLASLEQSTNSNQHAALSRQRIQIKQQLKTVRLMETLNNAERTGSRFAVVGTASTAANSALTTGAQISLVSTNHSPAAFAAVGIKTAVGLTAGGIGAASAALAMPIGVGAAGYGWYRLKKGKRRYGFFEQARARLEPMLAVRKEEQTSSSADAEQAYLRFLPIKLAQRGRFFRRFTGLSGGLCAGGTAFGASAAAKGAMIIAAAAGAGAALANPVVPPVLLAVGTFGLVVYAASSQQILYRLFKHKRYDRQRTADDPELDRQWLSTIDLWHEGFAKKGFALRARFYHLIDSREQKRQKWLAQIANTPGSKRYFQPIRYSTDDPESQPIGDPPPVTTKVAAQLRAGRLRASAWSTALIKKRSLSEANDASRIARQAPGTVLNTGAVAAWLADPDHQLDKIQWMRELIKDQQDYIKHKLESRDEVDQQWKQLGAAAQLKDPDPAATTSASDTTESAEPLDHLLASFDAGRERDERFKKELKLLDKSLAFLKRELECNNTSNLSSLLQLQGWFIELQQGRTLDPSKNYSKAGTNADLAHYLMHGAPLRDRELRGMLLETELDAASLRYEAYDILKREWKQKPAGANTTEKAAKPDPISSSPPQIPPISLEVTPLS